MDQQENPTIAFVNAESKAPRKKRIESDGVNFAKSLRPIYIFCRAFGLMSFTIVLDENQNFKGTRVRPRDIVLCTIAISLCIMMAVVYYQTIEQPKGQSVVLVFGDALLIIAGLIYACTVIIMNMINRSKLIAILKSLNNFDNSVCIFL